MSIERALRDDGKAHRIILRFATVTYWSVNTACGYDKATKAVLAPFRGSDEMEFSMPHEIELMTKVVRLMDRSFYEGKRRAKQEFREWLNG